MRDLLNKMVEYIEYTDSALNDLKNTPRFSDSALTKAASSLEEAGLIGGAEKTELVELFRNDPDKALESISKLATQLPREPDDYSLGQPADSSRAKPAFARESDRVLYEKLGLV